MQMAVTESKLEDWVNDVKEWAEGKGGMRRSGLVGVGIRGAQVQNPTGV